ncbi:MAG: ThiF family adenylyltransferase, partial [Phycisphaerae bacterium]|nr:ThiF family adenylyltransferase [Phycisphaerae bacterium]
MNRTEYYKRTLKVLNPDIAQAEVFLFDGVGSGGARGAEEAARFGVGTIILVDRPGERLEEHNIIRHTLGYRDLGRLKVE